MPMHTDPAPVDGTSVRDDSRPSVSLFSEPWWLDAVAPGGWDEVIHEKGGEIVARMPFTVKKRYGLTYLGMPPLTQHLGPTLRDTGGKPATRLAREKDLLTTLVGKLPRYDAFRQNFHHSVTNGLPFHWAGFTQSVGYTYVLPLADGAEAAWGGFDGRTRTSVRKAGELAEVGESGTVDELLDPVWATYARLGRSPPYTRELVHRVVDQATRRGRCETLFARDGAGELHAGALFVWDANTTYYLIGAATEAGRRSNAPALLLWRAIQRSAARSAFFDFEGSMVESIERFFRGFGASQTPYSQFRAASRRMRALQGLRELGRAIRGAG
jgi:hypothetical protein